RARLVEHPRRAREGDSSSRSRSRRAAAGRALAAASGLPRHAVRDATTPRPACSTCCPIRRGARVKPRWKEARPVSRRVLVEGELSLSAPCHLGGADPDATSERPVLRDETGRAYLPGTTLAGLLRAMFHDDAAAAALFGGAPGDEKGLQSP